MNDTMKSVAERVTGEELGLDQADAITAGLIAEYVLARPALSTMDKVGLTAIAELSQSDADLARSLMGELNV